MLWVCLAVMAVHFKQLDPALVAYAALGETDKILYIDSIKVNFSVIRSPLKMLNKKYSDRNLMNQILHHILLIYCFGSQKTSDAAVVKAETALLQGGLAEAEAILLQAALPARAIMLNLQMFSFEKLALLTSNFIPRAFIWGSF